MNFIKNIKFGIKESISGNAKAVSNKSIINSKNLTTSRIKLQKRKANNKGLTFSSIGFKKK